MNYYIFWIVIGLIALGLIAMVIACFCRKKPCSECGGTGLQEHHYIEDGPGSSRTVTCHFCNGKGKK